MTILGPGLIDPRTFNSETFALYGPGDVVMDTGAGTLLNSGIHEDPYRLIDGPLRRDRVPGTYDMFFSGEAGISGVTASGIIGISGTVMYLQFTPSVPLAPNTAYEALLVGDNLAGTYLEGSGRYLGPTTWTSDAEFTQSGTASSGIAQVNSSYDRILPTTLFDEDTGYNDTYTVTIISGNPDGSPDFTWSKESSAGTYSSDGGGIHSLGSNLTFEFVGLTITGQVYTLETYIPKPLETTYSWRFVTSELDASTPPVVVTPGDTVIDSSGGSFIIQPSTDGPLKVIDSYPENLEYAVISELGYIRLQFNKPLAQGVYAVGNVDITSTPLLGLPTSEPPTSIIPGSLEVSGVYLTIHLP